MKGVCMLQVHVAHANIEHKSMQTPFNYKRGVGVGVGWGGVRGVGDKNHTSKTLGSFTFTAQRFELP